MEKIVTSLELSKKLDKAGFKSESIYYWALCALPDLGYPGSGGDSEWDVHKTDSEDLYDWGDTEFRAYTATELLEWIDNRDIFYSIVRYADGYKLLNAHFTADAEDSRKFSGRFISFKEVLGGLVLWVLEEGK